MNIERKLMKRKMNKQERNKLMLEIEKFTDCYALIYKDKKGEYRVLYLHSKKEKNEIKSIFMNKLEKDSPKISTTAEKEIEEIKKKVRGNMTDEEWEAFSKLRCPSPTKTSTEDGE